MGGSGAGGKQGRAKGEGGGMGGSAANGGKARPRKGGLRKAGAKGGKIMGFYFCARLAYLGSK